MPAANQLSEPDLERCQIIPAAKVHRAAGKSHIGRQVTFRLLPAHFAADGPLADGHANAAQHRGTRRSAAPLEAVSEDAVVEAVHKLAGLFVPPVDDRDA